MSASETMIRARAPTPVEEAWIARHLDAPDLFAGSTTAEIRAARVRARIVALDVADAVAGKRDGQPETWAQLFHRLYNEPF